MTARELLDDALKDAGFQITKIFEKLPEEAWDQKAAPEGMTVREIATHLCECYYAFSEMAKGRKYEWGTYSITAMEPAHLLELMFGLRTAAANLALAGDAKIMKESLGYLCLHDAYHVGQIALVRIRLEPKWDPYSIYNV